MPIVSGGQSQEDGEGESYEARYYPKSIEHKKRRSTEQSKRYEYHLNSIYDNIHVYVCRKEWVKRQKIVHSYGEDDDCIDKTELQEQLQECIQKNTVPHSLPAIHTTATEGVEFTIGGKTCKCGSNTHQRISHRDCPLNKKKL